MKYFLDIRPSFVADVGGITEHLNEQDPAAAERFLLRAKATAESLIRLPLRVPLYAPATGSGPDGFRKIAIRGFPNHLLFFRVEGNRVRVIRLLHGARDLPPLLRLHSNREG